MAGQHRKVRFLEVVEVKEFSGGQEPSTTLDVPSGTVELKQKPLPFYDGSSDAWTPHASSDFSKRDDSAVGAEPKETEASLFRRPHDYAEVEEAGDIGEIARALVSAGELGGEVQQERDEPTGGVREVVVLDSVRACEAALRYSTQMDGRVGEEFQVVAGRAR